MMFLSGSAFIPLSFLSFLEISSRSSGRPLFVVYFENPLSMAFFAALAMNDGRLKIWFAYSKIHIVRQRLCEIEDLPNSRFLHVFQAIGKIHRNSQPQSESFVYLIMVLR